MGAEGLYIWGALFRLYGLGIVICELCGKEVPRTRTVSVDGTLLSVCGDCSRFGVEPAAPPRDRRRTATSSVTERLERRRRRMTPKDIYEAEGNGEDVVEDLGVRVRRAREEREWKQADLGAKINEKESVVAKIESGRIAPGPALVRKLERVLGLKLTEKVAPVPVKKPAPSGPLTVGDLIKREQE